MKKSIKYSVVLCALLPIVAMGADTWWNGHTVGDWENAGNWGAGVPTSADRAIINQADDQVTVNAAGAVANDMILKGSLAIASAADLTVGALSTATTTVAQPTTIVVDGQLTHGGGSWFQLGGAGGSTMTINSGASVTSSGSEFLIGQGGNASLTVDGTFDRAGWMHLGAGNTGNITVNSGGLLSIGVLNTAAGSTVDITINGGTSSIDVLKWGNAGTQTLNMNDGQLTLIGLEESAGNTFNIGDGELIFSGASFAAVDAIASGPNWHYADTKSVVDNGGSISITSIPEPATLLLMVLAGGGIVGSRRFRR